MSGFELVFLYDENQKTQFWSPWENQSLLPRGKGTHYIHLFLARWKCEHTAEVGDDLCPLRSLRIHSPGTKKNVLLPGVPAIHQPPRECCFSGFAEAFSFPTWLLNTVCQ